MSINLCINAGVCGFTTKVEATSEDNQFVVFKIDSPCEKIRKLAEALKASGPIDAFQEISPAGEKV